MFQKTVLNWWGKAEISREKGIRERGVSRDNVVKKGGQG